MSRQKQSCVLSAGAQRRLRVQRFVVKAGAVAMLGDEQQLPHRLPGLERRVGLRRLA